MKAQRVMKYFDRHRFSLAKKGFAVLCLCALISIPYFVSGQTDLVQIDGNRHLSYAKDADGFVLPDFSYAGYHNGDPDIPYIQVVKTISAVTGDNTAHLQAAIDEIGARTPDTNGFRGALLLRKGTYEVTGTVYVKYDGIVIRGEGNETTGTVIRATGDTPHQRDVIVIGNTSQNKWNSGITGKQNITNDVVPVGAMSFTIVNASSYKTGDLIGIYHPCTAQWLQAVNYGGVPAPGTGEEDERWTVDQLPILYHRYITAVSGNTITIDAPVFYSLNKSLAQSYIYKFSTGSGTSVIRKEIGIENLRVEIISTGGVEDENHAWQAIRFKTAENCWAKNVVTKGFGQSGFITDCCTRSTIEDCRAIDPVSIVTGERRYNFNTYTHSQLILFKNCYASNGRHHYISNGTSFASGNVFLRCTSDAVQNANEGHRQWTQGMLYDNHKEINLERDFVLGLYNRVDMGTGHGWAAVHSVLWNCDVTAARGVIGLQKPPTAQNYAIGCTAKSITGKPVSSTNFPIGYVEKQNQPVTAIESLYEAQLYDRKNNTSPIDRQTVDANTVIKRIGTDKIGILFDSSSPEERQIFLYNTLGQILNSEQTNENYIEMTLPATGGIIMLCIENKNTKKSYKIVN